MQAPLQNELILKEIPPSKNQQKSLRRGLPIKQKFSVKNQGKKLSRIQIRIRGNDNQSQQLHLWCAIEPESLDLKGNEAKNFTLTFEIPIGEKAESYNYEILLIESSQYPPRVTRHFQKLQLQKSDLAEFPEFIVQPVTSADLPAALKAGESLKVSVSVENRSELVDRFYLSCPDLPKEWYQISYSHSNIPSFQLANLEEGLNLNPNRKGIIEFLLKPPQYTLEGIYSPTLCLTSKTYREAVLLDIFYFRILPDDRLEVELSPSLCTFPAQKQKKKRDRQNRDPESEFLETFASEDENPVSEKKNNSKNDVQLQYDIVVKLKNIGNIEREIIINPNDSENLFKYDPPSRLLVLEPGIAIETGFKVKSWHGWRRTLWGKGIQSQFLPEFENATEWLLPDTQELPAVPDIEELRQDREAQRNKKLKIDTVLVLKARPWWILFSIIALILSAIAGILFILFYLPAPPRIRVLETVNSQQNKVDRYELIKNDAVWLKIKISSPNELEKIAVVQVQEGTENIRKIYEPTELATRSDFLAILPEQEGRTPQLPDTYFISLGKLAEGQYKFEVELFPKERQTTLGVRKRSNQKRSDTSTTNTIDVLPRPQPILSALRSSKSLYQKKVGLPLILEWDVENQAQLGKVTILRKAEDGTVEDYSYSREEIQFRSALVVTSEEEVQIGDSEELEQEDILECADQSATQLSCAWKRDISTVPSGNFTFVVEVFSRDNPEQPSDTKQTRNTIFVARKPLPKIEKFSVVDTEYIESANDILVDFEVSHPQQIQELIFRLNSSSGQSEVFKQYPYPQGLASFCSIPKPTELEKKLRCQRVPLGKLPTGDYSFEMIVISTEETEETISKVTDSVRVESKPIKVRSFKINGKETQHNSLFLYANHAKTPGFLEFSWDVEAGEGVTVQLLPIGGPYPLRGSLSYAVPPGTSREIFTLQATDPLGKITSHLVTVQAYESNSPPLQDLPFGRNGNNGDSIPTQPRKPGLPRPTERPSRSH